MVHWYLGRARSELSPPSGLTLHCAIASVLVRFAHSRSRGELARLVIVVRALYRRQAPGPPSNEQPPWRSLGSSVDGPEECGFARYAATPARLTKLRPAATPVSTPPVRNGCEARTEWALAVPIWSRTGRCFAALVHHDGQLDTRARRPWRRAARCLVGAPIELGCVLVFSSGWRTRSRAHITS